MSTQTPNVAPILPSDANPSRSEVSEPDNQKAKKGEKRRFFGLVKRKDSDKDGKKAGSPVPSTKVTSVAGNASPQTPVDMRARSPKRPVAIDPRSPGSPNSAMSDAISPSRFRSASPRLHSPASSLIFERNVQENPIPDDLSHSIPSHIQTEDHIPAVLEASSIAITDDHLNPDEVEIVMHTAHQPAGVTVTGAVSDSGALSPIDDVVNGTMPETTDDNASTYGSIDPADVRRLSFISFADVVQSEHVDHSKDSVLHMSISSATNRSPSPPVRSPASSHGFGPSPPTSGAPSVKGIDDVSMAPRLPGSPTTAHGTHSPPLGGGELMVETMRQALRKTGSGDLRSPQTMSALSLDDSAADKPPFKA
jgi:hypothetical protein